MNKHNEIHQPNSALFADIRQMIEQSRQKVAVTVNAEMSMLYWHIGKRIKEDVLQNKRAEYGKQILSTLSGELTREYGTGWSEKQLRHCLRTAETFPDKEIFSALRRKLSWTHIKSIIYIEDELKRSFYIQMCKLENWSSRVLQDRINSMLYERTAISKKPEDTVKNDLKKLEAEQKLNPDLVNLHILS
jgi:hypothetical protein